ncbi:MAG: UPF0149 family protein [Proteobacteria bacterium]|nr:UPF0149 family protein [Pseudomonadota bacterium]
MTYHAANDDSNPGAARDALHALLQLRAVPFGGLSLEGLDGFLTALAVGPELVLPSEWMTGIWGSAEPRWESQAEAVRVYGLLTDLWNDVLRRAALDPSERIDADDAPLFNASNGQPLAADWAEGFLDGMEFAPEGWDDWADAQVWIDDALLDIEALTWPVVPEGFVPDDGGPAIEESGRNEILADLPRIINALHRHRLVEETARTPIRRDTPKIGRNDPCPCGSGRKYKRCCGATAE